MEDIKVTQVSTHGQNIVYSRRIGGAKPTYLVLSTTDGKIKGKFVRKRVAQNFASNRAIKEVSQAFFTY